jgi:hypothetical protein
MRIGHQEQQQEEEAKEQWQDHELTITRAKNMYFTGYQTWKPTNCQL